jgi:hypothetical protein
MSTMTETTTPERPEWLEQGAEVGVIAGGYAETAAIETVERFTKTQVILTNGDRYALRGLDRRIGGRGAFGHTARLAPITDPKWRRLRAATVVSDRASILAATQREMRSNPTVEDVARARVAAQALAEAYATLHRVMVATGRG